MERVESEAIGQILAGDRDASRILTDRHFHAIHRVTFRVTGNESEAEEAAQEAFLRAYNKLSTFRKEANFPTWIIRIAMNTSINLMERRKRDLSHYAPRVGEENDPGGATTRWLMKERGQSVRSWTARR